MVMVMYAPECVGSLRNVDDEEDDSCEGDGDDAAGDDLPCPRCNEMPASPLGRCVFGFMQKADSSSLQQKITCLLRHMSRVSSSA